MRDDVLSGELEKKNVLRQERHFCQYPVHRRARDVDNRVTRILYIDTQNLMSQTETTEETTVCK